MAALALPSAVLCAARTAEVLGTSWHDLDVDAKVWHVPASRMKAGRPHDVPLSTQELAVLDHVRGLHPVVVFPTTAGVSGRLPHLSNMAMRMALDRAGLREGTTVRGPARATFSTRANERRVARSEVVEAALRHADGKEPRAADNRAVDAEEHRALLEVRGDCSIRARADVVELRAA